MGLAGSWFQSCFPLRMMIEATKQLLLLHFQLWKFIHWQWTLLYIFANMWFLLHRLSELVEDQNRSYPSEMWRCLASPHTSHSVKFGAQSNFHKTSEFM